MLVITRGYILIFFYLTIRLIMINHDSPLLTAWWFQTLWKIWVRQLGWWNVQSKKRIHSCSSHHIKHSTNHSTKHSTNHSTNHYPLVISYIAIEHHHFLSRKFHSKSMAMASVRLRRWPSPRHRLWWLGTGRASHRPGSHLGRKGTVGWGEKGGFNGFWDVLMYGFRDVWIFSSSGWLKVGWYV